MNARIVVLPGDGIGPEIVGQAIRVLDEVAKRFQHSFEYDQQLIGGSAVDATGSPLPEETVAACNKAAAVLLGAVGGPRWDRLEAAKRPETGLLGIRKRLGLFANIRPVRVFPGLIDASPLRPERLAGVDLVIVRELTGGLYFGEPRFRETTNEGQRAVDTLAYTELEIRRILEVGFRLAQTRRKKLTSVDKANVLESSRLWRELAEDVARAFPDVELEHQLVDSCAMRLVTAPASFDVVVTENLFGDILSDEAAVLPGTLGLLPSASLSGGSVGLYEPIHGSAPDIAGKGIANPLATILSAAMLLRHSLGQEREAQAIETAVRRALDDGLRTADLKHGAAPGKVLSTGEMGQAVIDRL